MPAQCLSEARLEACDVGALVRKAHPRGGGLVRGGQVGVPKGHPALRGLQLRGVGLVCRVEECAERARCSFPSAEGDVEPAASDSEVGCYLLWCTVTPVVSPVLSRTGIADFIAEGLLRRPSDGVGLTVLAVVCLCLLMLARVCVGVSTCARVLGVTRGTPRNPPQGHCLLLWGGDFTVIV